MAGFFGTSDGTGSTPRFSNPNGVAVASAGNLFIADYNFNTTRKGYPPPKILNSGFALGQFGFNLTGPPWKLVIMEGSTHAYRVG